MPQRRDNAGAVCDSGMGVLFLTPIFVVQKATAPKNGAEFRQGSIGTIRSSLATSYDVWRRRQFSTNQRPRNYLRYTHRQRINILSGPALRAAPAKIWRLTDSEIFPWLLVSKNHSKVWEEFFFD